MRIARTNTADGSNMGMHLFICSHNAAFQGLGGSALTGVFLLLLNIVSPLVECPLMSNI